ncbi:LamG domain-containing protein [Candidatus Woesearchaeota archaeon]|nr:LamG domain-containing protein [Candidatus Woesearchaeota archaeon]
MKHSKKSQVAMEYLALIAFVMIVLGVISYIYFNKSSEVKDSLTNSQIDTISDEIDKAVNTLYSYGEGSQSLVKVNFPQNVESVKVEGRDLVFTVKNQKGGISEIAKSFAFDIKLGSVMTKMPGEKTFVVKSLGENQVFIGEKNSLDYLRTNVVGLWHLDDATNIIKDDAYDNFGSFDLESTPTLNFCTGKSGSYCDGNDLVFCNSGIQEARSNCNPKRCYPNGISSVCDEVCRETGKIGKACEIFESGFGGPSYLAGKGITIPYSPRYDLTNKITLSIWVKDPKIPAQGWIIPFSRQELSNPNVPYALTLCNGDSTSCGMLTRKSSASHYSGTTLNGGFVPNNNWHHIVGVYDKSLASNNLKIYIDGVLKGQSSWNEDLAFTPNANLLLGSIYWVDYSSYNVILDEAIIFNASLSDTEIKTLYAQQNNGYGFDYY